MTCLLIILEFFDITSDGFPLGSEPHVNELYCPADYTSLYECDIGVTNNGVCTSTLYDAVLKCYALPITS